MQGAPLPLMQSRTTSASEASNNMPGATNGLLDRPQTSPASKHELRQQRVDIPRPRRITCTASAPGVPAAPGCAAIPGCWPSAAAAEGAAPAPAADEVTALAATLLTAPADHELLRHALTAPLKPQLALWQHHVTDSAPSGTVRAKESSMCEPLPHSGQMARMVPTWRGFPGSSPHSSTSSSRSSCSRGHDAHKL